MKLKNVLIIFRNLKAQKLWNFELKGVPGGQWRPYHTGELQGEIYRVYENYEFISTTINLTISKKKLVYVVAQINFIVIV